MGTLEFGPMQRAPGTTTVDVDATISATCP